MTRAGRTGVIRQAEDYYPTPEHSVASLLKVWNPPRVGRWIEPCVGDGAIVRATSNFYGQKMAPKWTAIDLVERPIQLGLFAPEIEWRRPQDFLSWVGPRHSVCLTNPPFNLALEFILHSLSLADIVAMLLRLDFLGTQKRYPFHKSNPCDVKVLSNRPFPD